MERSSVIQPEVYQAASREATSDTVDRNQMESELVEVRAALAGDHAERSRRLVEGATSAENIRNSSENVAEYIQGLATEKYLRLTEEEGVGHEEAVAHIDAFIAEQTHELLHSMAEKRTENVTAHNRFIPKRVGQLYDKALEVWRSWEVPTGDGTLVSRLRESDTWQHLERKSEGNSRAAKLGKFALLAVKSSINGVENLKYSGARKRLAAMAGIGMVAGAAAGAFLGAAGAGAAGVVAGSIAARSGIRSGVSMKLNRDANVSNRALYDQVRMQGGIDQITSGAYTVEDILGYVDGETKTMLQENNVRLLSSMAIGLVGGLAGNSIARGMSWAAGRYIDAQFNTSAHADTGNITSPDHVVSEGTDAPTHVIRSTNAPVHVMNGTVTPDHLVNGMNSQEISHVVGTAVRPNHVIDGMSGRDTAPNHVIYDTGSQSETAPNHVIHGSDKNNDVAPNHVIDGMKKSKASAEDGGDSEQDIFTVESGNGFIREIQDYAKENGYGKLSSEDAYKMHLQLLDEHGKNGLIDVHGIKKDVYVENGDVRISAAGKAHWRSGVEDDLETMMRQHEAGDKLTLKASHDTTVKHGAESDIDEDRPDHVIDGDSSSSSETTNDYTSDVRTMEKGETGTEFAEELGIQSVDDQYTVWNDVAPGFEDSGLTYQSAAGDWRLNMTENGRMPVSMIDAMVDSAHEHGISTDYSEINSFTSGDYDGIPSAANEAYYDALKDAGVDPSKSTKVLEAAAHELQNFKDNNGAALAYKAPDGEWHFREVSELPREAREVLARVADKNHWSLAS